MDKKTAKNLEYLAENLNRSKNYILNEAASQYIVQEMSLYSELKKSLKQADEGKLIPHEEAMKRLDKTFKRLKKKHNK